MIDDEGRELIEAALSWVEDEELAAKTRIHFGIEPPPPPPPARPNAFDNAIKRFYAEKVGEIFGWPNRSLKDRR